MRLHRRQLCPICLGKVEQKETRYYTPEISNHYDKEPPLVKAGVYRMHQKCAVDVKARKLVRYVGW